VLTLLATEAGEVAEEAANPILPVPSELFWGAICFFALWALVKFVLLPPVLQVMDERARKIRSDLDAADAARLSAGSAASEVHDQLADVRAEAASIVDAARAEAEAERATIMAAAEAEVAALHAEVAIEVEAARSQALAGVQPQIASLASQAASRVLDRPIDAGVAQPAVDRFLSNPN
jgi:F-type H+-transporting ATPase subunit b